ncbi:MAG: type II secretion system F family protein [Vulcanimicrobiota bacterium]
MNPSAESLSLFFRSMAVMFTAGISLDRALHLLADQSEDAKMAEVSRDLAQRISQGIPLSKAFSTHQQAFSNIQVRLLTVGERTGNVDAILHRLALYEEKRRAVTMKIRGALTYPAFLMAIATFMLVVLPPYMFKGLFQMIETTAVDPPLITVLVVGFSKFVRTPWFWGMVLALVGMGVTVGPSLWRQPGFRLWLAERILATPVLGRTYQNLGTARFARAMELQLQVGEGPLAGFRLSAEASDNPVLSRSIEGAIEALKGGEGFTDSLKATGFFPNSFLQVMRAGEESADLPEMMGRMATMFEEELDHSIDTFTALLEPLVMLVMGIIVGVVVIATMLPMMQLIQNL